LFLLRKYLLHKVCYKNIINSTNKQGNTKGKAMLLHYIRQYKALNKEALALADQASHTVDRQEYELLKVKAIRCLEKAKEYNALIRLC